MIGNSQRDNLLTNLNSNRAVLGKLSINDLVVKIPEGEGTNLVFHDPATNKPSFSALGGSFGSTGPTGAAGAPGTDGTAGVFGPTGPSGLIGPASPVITERIINSSPFTVPPNVYLLNITAQGGGGGGGAGNQTGAAGNGGSGGGGAMAAPVSGSFPVLPGDSLLFSIGGGGLASLTPGSTAGNGGATQVTYGPELLLLAPGGAGGVSCSFDGNNGGRGGNGAFGGGGGMCGAGFTVGAAGTGTYPANNGEAGILPPVPGGRGGNGGGPGAGLGGVTTTASATVGGGGGQGGGRGGSGTGTAIGLPGEVGSGAGGGGGSGGRTFGVVGGGAGGNGFVVVSYSFGAPP